MEHQFMFGSNILACPKVFQKFIKPNETVVKQSEDLHMEAKNEG
jgi:hypothetical protein